MFELFIAKRIYKEKDGNKQVSRPAILIATAGIAIGLAVMIISVAVVIGFKKEVSSKVKGFGSHIQISNFDAVRSFETYPIIVPDSMWKALENYPDVKHVQRYSTKPGMIKTDDAFQGMILKGAGQEYDFTFFRDHLVEGEIPAFSDSVASNEVLISKTLANKLKLQLGDRVYTYYFEKDIRARRLTIKGIYQTNSSEYDNYFLITDIYTVNRLYGWNSGQVSGLELQIYDYDKLAEVTYKISSDTDRYLEYVGTNNFYYIRSIEQINPQIFDWLNFLDMNVWLILILMVGVAGFTMISGLLIIILERTNMIGVLKALGATNYSIRKIFLWFSIFLISKGMFWGNIIAMGFYFLQTHFNIFKLDPETYYTDSVPMSLSLSLFLLINLATLTAAVLMLIGPSFLITRINPVTSMRYE